MCGQTFLLFNHTLALCSCVENSFPLFLDYKMPLKASDAVIRPEVTIRLVIRKKQRSRIYFSISSLRRHHLFGLLFRLVFVIRIFNPGEVNLFGRLMD